MLGKYLWRGAVFPVVLIVALCGLFVPATAEAGSSPQAVSFGPYSGTAQVTFSSCLLCEVGISAEASQAANMLPITETVHFAVRDLTHYRVAIQTLSPTLLSGTRTAVLNGSTMTVYDDRTGTASNFPVPAIGKLPFVSGASDFLQLLQNGNDLGAGTPSGDPPLPQATDSFGSYLARLQKTLPGAQVVGTATMLGRNANIVEYSTQSGYDLKIWVDADQPAILQYQAGYLGSPQTTYTVTSFGAGTGPSDADLAFRPSVPTTFWDRYPGTATGSSGAVSSPPGGFLDLPDPTSFTPACQVDGYAEQGLDYTAQSWQQLYIPDKATCSLVQVQPTWNGSYLLVQQERQAGGLPAGFTSGQLQMVSGCPVYSGTYGNGELWAALERNGIAIQLTTNFLTADQLLQYAGTVCTAAVSHASAIPPSGPDPSLWYCAFGGPNHWQIFIYNYAQKSEQCFKHLDEAVDAVPASVTKIVPDGATGYLTCTGGEGNAALDPPGGVYVTRCPGTPPTWTAQWSGFPTDGPAPIKGTVLQRHQVVVHKSHHKKHKKPKHGKKSVAFAALGSAVKGA
jgi:hypothetical protein